MGARIGTPHHRAVLADELLRAGVHHDLDIALDQRPSLASLQCPVLVMCGDGDRLTPPDCSQEIAQVVPHAELVWIETCGHMLTMEKPAFVNAALLSWLGQWS